MFTALVNHPPVECSSVPSTRLIFSQVMGWLMWHYLRQMASLYKAIYLTPKKPRTWDETNAVQGIDYYISLNKNVYPIAIQQTHRQ